MDIALQLFLLVGGLAVALVASEYAVSYTRALAAALGAPAFIVGVVLVSAGTDLPEMANSVAAHLQGEGDVNVGNTVGSTLTQYTLVLGLLPFFASRIPVVRRDVGVVSALIVAGLLITAAFVANGWLGRLEGVALIALWAIALAIVIRGLPSSQGAPEDPPEVRQRKPAVQAGIVLLSLGFVAFGATVAVRALVRLAEQIGVPEFALAFFGAAFGTSAPELIVDVTAVIRGAPGIAVGNALGSSLYDATITPGLGPLVAPAEVTPSLAVTGTLYAAFAVAATGILLGLRRVHDRASGATLIGLYALAYVVLIQAS